MVQSQRAPVSVPAWWPAAGFLLSDLGLDGEGKVAAQLVHPASGGNWQVAVTHAHADYGRKMVSGRAVRSVWGPV